MFNGTEIIAPEGSKTWDLVLLEIKQRNMEVFLKI